MSVFGKTTVGGTIGGVNSGQVRAGQYTLSETGLVSKLTIHLANTSNQSFIGCIYEDAAGLPGRLLAQTVEITPGATESWIDFAFATTVVLAAAPYWLGWEAGGGSGQASFYYEPTGGSRARQVLTYPTLPDPFGPPVGTDTFALDIYATYSTPIQLSLPRPFTRGLR